MRIGELAEQAGVNPKTIRYYEAIGVLPAPDRTTAGYRRYRDVDVDRLVFVRRDELSGLLANTEPLDDEAGGYCQLIEHTQTSDG